MVGLPPTLFGDFLFPSTNPREDRSPDFFQELCVINARIPERALVEGEAVYLVVVREHNAPPVWMLHFNVAAFPVNFHKAKAL